MKAEVVQQRSLLELADLDAELSRIEHRSGHLAEQQRFEQTQAEHREANDRLASLRLALEDLDAQIAKFESEIEAVRDREDRDRTMLEAGAISAKQLADLQHELETLERRQSSLEDSLLEVMERREELQAQQADELGQDRRAGKRAGRSPAGAGRRARGDRADPAPMCLAARRIDRRCWIPIWCRCTNASASHGGAGAGRLQGRRCGACRIEIDRGELARISAAADDEVLRCPECGAILLRVKDGDQ